MPKTFSYERLLCTWVFHLLITPVKFFSWRQPESFPESPHSLSYGLLLEIGPIDFTRVTLLTSRMRQEDVGCVIYSTIGEAFQKLAAHAENPIPLLFTAVQINQELLATCKNVCRVYAGGGGGRLSWGRWREQMHIQVPVVWTQNCSWLQLKARSSIPSAQYS